MSIPHNLKTIRSKYRVSQEAFGKMLSVTRQMINTYEQGIAIPSIEFILKLSSITGISADTLFYKHIREEDLPDQFIAEEPLQPYGKVNLYDLRNLIQELKDLRKEIDELKKKG